MTTSTVTYCTLFRVGYWCSLDAKCETITNAELPCIDHEVHFRLLNKYGEHLHIDSVLITGQPHTAEVCDEDGEKFLDLDTAIRARANRLVCLTAMLGRRVATPPRYDTWQDTPAAAF